MESNVTESLLQGHRAYADKYVFLLIIPYSLPVINPYIYSLESCGGR